ncbi:MAG TPA: PilZ domain-containing protein [Planctomycetaceae bacterium]|nr:PilZ domain-containing protein [Planctomycetaceae bacterium]
MSADPWSRPTLQDLREVLERIERADPTHDRAAERLELSVPAEIVTARGSVVPAMTREISRFGIGLLHRGSVSPGEVTVKMNSDTREYRYRVMLEWCRPADNGMFMSGGRFLSKVDADVDGPSQ